MTILRKTIKILLIGMLLTFLGCANVKPVQTTKSESVHFYQKNYEIGVQKSSYVGEEMVKLKDYYIIKTSAKVMQVKNDFETNTTPKYTGTKGETYPIVGEITKIGQTIILIQIPETHMRFGINGNGEYANITVSPSNEYGIGYKIYPSNTKFETVLDEKIDINKSFNNFEIVFTGISSQSINLLYREYTPDDIAKAAFYQNLTYPLDSTMIRFKQIQIKIDKLSSEKILFTVLEDGTK